MGKFKVPNTYVIIFTVLLVCAVATWFVPGGEPQTWQVFSALYEGFSQQAGIIAFVLIIGGAFWVVNSTKAVDNGIMKFIGRIRHLERYGLIRKLGVGNIVITLVMLLFGLFGAVFGMSEETIAFVAVVIPLARMLGYDDITGLCMVYLAAHVGFAGAMLNPFTIGIAQDMSGLPLFSGIEYRTICWLVLMAVAIAFVLWYASTVRKPVAVMSEDAVLAEDKNDSDEKGSGLRAWVTFAVILVSLVLFSVFYGSGCTIKIGQSSFSAPWLMWVLTFMFAAVSVWTLVNSTKMFILNMLMFTIVFMVVGVMGYGWYLPEICALFMALAVASGFAADYSADDIAKEFIAGAKDIFSAALIIGFAAGIIVILKNGQVIDVMLNSMASALDGSGKVGALGTMYGIQTFINLFIPSASAKAAVTMPIMAPFSDLIGVSRQATVLAFQFGDGFTNMITPCSGVLMAVLSVAKIPYEKWFRFIWKFILLLVIIGFLLLLPTVFLDLPGF
ncbi:MAG: YfcC family protein [Bacteroidales bacterium]|nr:YfcC family protein [Bacteroidales bacterium]